MAHSFLLESGFWTISGHCIQPNLMPIAIEGNVKIAWKDRNWFKTSLEMTSPEEASMIFSCRYRGNLALEEKHYTYVAQHSHLGNIEGEGRLGIKSIVQHYWTVGTTYKKRGWETFYALNEHTYFYTSSVLESHNINNIIEATFQRQS